MLRAALFTLLVLTVLCPAFAQKGPLTQTYPKTLSLPSTEFGVLASNATKPFPLTAVPGDTVDLGNDGYPGAYALILTGRDTVRINYTNVPFDQRVYIPMQTPAGKATYRLRFNGVAGQFTDDYVRQHLNTTDFTIPEAYELANILWLLSAHGQRNTTLPKSGPYYDRVMAHFQPFLNHPVLAAINQQPDTYSTYYDFRENSYAFRFDGENLRWDGPHYYVTGNDWDTYNSLFRQLLPQIQDFVRQSKFRAFYQKEQPYYKTLIAQQQQLMPIRTMWTWLEERFSERFQRYEVVFSPLIGGTHSTQQYARNVKGDLYREAVMFVNGPTDLLSRPGLTDAQRQGIASAIVFTEIDHNYVNPVTWKFRKRVDSLFSNRAIWTKTGDDTDYYGTPQAVFNEYMTHAVFCLYVRDQYDPQTAAFLIDRRTQLMVDRRRFHRFKEFNQKITDIYIARQPNQPIAALYPALLDWAATQQ